MQDAYEKFYKTNWEEVYGFWHKVITRGEHQVKILIENLNSINKGKITILDLGCGSGDEIKEALSKAKNKEFVIIANDTSEEALEKYRKNIDVKETIQERLENLPKKLSGKFDIILFSHCLYSVELKGLFKEYLKLLSDDGTILIFLDSKESGIKLIQQKFWNEIHNKNFDENTGEDVLKELENENMKYEAIEFSNYMDFKKLENLRKDGITSLLIPFALRTNEIKKECSEEIASYIEKLKNHGKLENKTFAIMIKSN
ncbi:MAG TPA: class I SAM-dependent methyltransferase [archaeon]|nr:class I SAM-dependent methyltransferase [archaeon]